MLKSGIDQDALIEQFATASAKQTAQLKAAVTEATLKALQGREMSLKNIRSVIKSVTEAASTGAAQNLTGKIDIEKMLDTAVAGMDDALLKAVEANRTALSTLAAQGADLRDKHLTKAMDDLDKMEDAMFAAVKKTAAGAGAPLAGAWGAVLEKMQAGGTLTGVQASATTEQMAQQMQDAMRSTRAASMRAAQALAESYTAVVSGVLMGMSEALQSTAEPKKTGRK